MKDSQNFSFQKYKLRNDLQILPLMTFQLNIPNINIIILPQK